MTDWQAGRGAAPDPVEAALERASSKSAARNTALITAVVTFSLAALAAGYFASRPVPEPAAAVIPRSPPPVEPPTLLTDDAAGHSLPYRKFGPEEPRESTRSLGEIKKRPKPSPPVRRAAIAQTRPAPVPEKRRAAPPPKPVLADGFGKAKPGGGGNFIGGAAMGVQGAGFPPVAEGGEDAAIRATRDPAGYAAEEQKKAMRAFNAVLLGNDKNQQIIEWNKQEVYEAQEAVAAAVTQDHSGRSVKKKSASTGAVKIGKDGKPLNLPDNMQAELERLGKQYKKKFSKE